MSSGRSSACVAGSDPPTFSGSGRPQPKVGCSSSHTYASDGLALAAFTAAARSYQIVTAMVDAQHRAFVGRNCRGTSPIRGFAEPSWAGQPGVRSTGRSQRAWDAQIFGI